MGTCTECRVTTFNNEGHVRIGGDTGRACQDVSHGLIFSMVSFYMCFCFCFALLSVVEVHRHGGVLDYVSLHCIDVPLHVPWLGHITQSALHLDSLSLAWNKPCGSVLASLLSILSICDMGVTQLLWFAYHNLLLRSQVSSELYLVHRAYHNLLLRSQALI